MTVSARPLLDLRQPDPAHAADGTRWTVQCDFDGTISVLDVTDSLLQRFGLPGWQALEDDWDAGRIGSRACMQGQVALLAMSREQLLQHLDGMAIDPQFPAFVRAAHARGLAVQVVSDGLDLAIRQVLARHGLAELPVFANQLLPDPARGPDRWQLHTPHAQDGCLRAAGNCKCARAAEQHALQHRVLYVGDGSSDFCVSARADLVLAKDKLLAHCQQHALPHLRCDDFGQALQALHTLLGDALPHTTTPHHTAPHPARSAVPSLKELL
jgi:2,3-diketo-5-methylthio-1-phosphopentane phosphatase